ncbi:hypothetical protein A3K72_00425, partial [Candidatus Woesearchaeota archaeon RBG_13_36_6]
MKVSIIIPTYNRKEVLELVLKSLAYQSYDPKKYEVIVVDDGGNDGTDEMVKKMIKEVPYELRYYWQERKGFRAGQARNLGVKHSKGEMIIFLDSDVVVVPDFITEHVKVHKKSKKAVCIGYVSGHITGTLQNKNYDYEEVKEIIDNNPDQITQLEIIPEYREEIYQKCNNSLNRYKNPWEAFYTNNVSILKKNLKKFDENFIGWGYEDIDLGYRLFKKKLKFNLNRYALGYSLDKKESHPCPMFDPQKDKFEKTLENIKRLAKKHSSKDIKEY